MPNTWPTSCQTFDVVLLKVSILVFFLYVSSWFYSNGEYSSLFVVCTLAYVAILFWAARQFGIFDARFVFLAVSGLYPFTSVLDIAIAAPGEGYFNVRNSALILLLSTSLFSGFFVFSSFSLPDAPTSRGDFVDQINFSTLIFLLYAALVVYLALLYRDIGFSIGARTRAEVTAAATALFSVTRLGLFVGLLVMIAKLWSMPRIAAQPAGANTESDRERGRKRWHVVSALVLVAAFFFVDVVVLGDRRFVLTFALAALCIVAPKRIPLVALIGIPVLLVVFQLFQLVRNSPVDEWASRLTERNITSALTPANLEFGTFGRVADDILSGAPITRFPTYTDAVLALIPQALYPERPEAISVWFVRNYYPKDWAVGGGLAFNLVIEAMLNLGLFGPLILGALLGLGFNVAISSTGRHRLAHGLLVFALVFAMRFDMATLLKTVVIVAAMAAGWLILVLRSADAVAQTRS